MYNPVYIKINNLFTHYDTHYEFKNNDLSVFLGINEDDEGANSNGSGKSTLIEGLTLVLTGDVYRDVTKEEFITDGESQCNVELLLNNPTLGHDITIRRTIYNNTKPQSLYIKFSNKQKQESFASINEGNSAIFNILGITKDDFLNYFVISQDNSDSFFKSKDTKQKEIIGRFCNYDVIDTITQNIQNDVKKLILQQSSVEDESKRVNNRIELLETQLQNLQEKNIEDNVDVEISNIEKTISKINSDINQFKSNISNNNAHIKSLQKQLEDFKELEQKYNYVESEIESISSNIHNYNKSIRKKELLLESSIVCPKCDNEFVINEDVDISWVRKELLQLKKQLDDLKSQRQQKIVELELLQKQLNDVESINTNIRLYNKKISIDEDNVELSLNSINTLRTSIENLRKTKVNNKKNDILSIKKQINCESKTLESILLNYQEFEDKIQQQNKLIFHLSRTGFKTYLANQNIKHIQDMTNYYLNKFNTNLCVEISGFKLLKSGELRDKITVKILKNDNKSIKIGSYARYSGGEKARVDLCSIIALHTIINNNVEHGKGLNLLCLDEWIQNLDIKGTESVLDILYKTNITTICVMHHIENLSIRNKVLFIKKDNKTTINQ